MGQNSYLRQFYKYVSANVISMIGLSCYILVDTFFISLGMGADGLAALNLAIPMYSIVNGIWVALPVTEAATTLLSYPVINMRSLCKA